MQIMTALLEYLHLLRDVWEAKLAGQSSRGKAAACKAKRSFLINLTRLIVLCVYPEKYTPLRVRHPDFPDLRALLRAGCVMRIKLAF